MSEMFVGFKTGENLKSIFLFDHKSGGCHKFIDSSAACMRPSVRFPRQ